MCIDRLFPCFFQELEVLIVLFNSTCMRMFFLSKAAFVSASPSSTSFLDIRGREIGDWKKTCNCLGNRVLLPLIMIAAWSEDCNPWSEALALWCSLVTATTHQHVASMNDLSSGRRSLSDSQAGVDFVVERREKGYRKRALPSLWSGSPSTVCRMCALSSKLASSNQTCATEKASTTTTNGAASLHIIHPRAREGSSTSKENRGWLADKWQLTLFFSPFYQHY